MTRARWTRCSLCREMFDASAVVPPTGVCLVPAETAIFGPLCSECMEILSLVAVGLGEDVVLAVSGPLPVGDLLPAAADDPHVAWHIDYDVPLGECSLCVTRGGAR